jgi:RNA polymerase sigma-70 factor, ECF subfamily
VRDKNVPQPEPDDELLVARVVQRDVAAFTLLYDRYVNSVYTMAVYMLGAADAEEVVQEVFLRLWHRTDQFDSGRGSFKAWFTTVVRHYILDELRQRSQQQQHLVVAEDINQLLASAKDPLVDVEQEVGLREESKTVLHALQSLPPEQRRALVLAYFGGLSQSTIAQNLGWPLGTVKKRIRLGMQKLRAALISQKVTAEVENRSTPE